MEFYIHFCEFLFNLNKKRRKLAKTVIFLENLVVKSTFFCNFAYRTKDKI